MKKIIILILSIFLLTGCYNYKELNDAAIVSAIAIDKCDDNINHLSVSVQIMNAKKDEESSQSEITFYKACGETIYESLQSITLDSPKELYLGDNEVIIISEELLKDKDPLSYLDYFLRDAKSEKDSLILIAKDTKAYNTLKILTPLETIPSQNIKSSLYTSSKYAGLTNITTLDEFISQLINKGEEVILPSLEIIGDIKEGENIDNLSQSDPKAKIKFSDLGVFKNNKLLGYLNNKDSLGYNLIKNEANNSYINFKCDNESYSSIRIESSKTKEEIKFVGNTPTVYLNNELVFDLIEYNCSGSFTDNTKLIKKIEKEVSKKTEDLINNIVDKLYKEYEIDTLNYGSKFYKHYNKKLKKYNIKRNDVKNHLKFNIKTKSKLNSTELTIKSIIKGDYNDK